MKLKTNYHTHTNFCDGNDSAEKMILSAIEKHFDILGFSSHSMFPHGSTWHISPKEHQQYFNQVRKLSKNYEEEIKVLCGLEADYIQSFSFDFKNQFLDFAPDYIIGSVHYIVNEEGFFTIDDTAQNVEKGIIKLFNGNGKKAVCEYFSLQREMLKKGGFEILGHADIVRKRNGVLHFFNEKDSWYKNELKATTKEIAKAGVIVEINTGGIARKCIDDVYPSAEFLALLHQKGVPITISSDSHSSETLDFAFDKAINAARNAGYTECAYLDSKNSIKMQKL